MATPTELRQGRLAARCGCLGLARHENSFGGMLCLAHKISDRLSAALRVQSTYFSVADLQFFYRVT